MGDYYDSNYGRSYKDYDYDKPNGYGIPSRFSLGNTPLNESLIYLTDLLPKFKKKYGIEKMTLITLTDGGANGMRGTIKGAEERSDWEKKKVFIMPDGKKLVKDSYGSGITEMLLNYIGKKYDTNVIGFYILKRVRKWDLERYSEADDWAGREKDYLKMRKQMTRDKAVVVNKKGYNKYFLLDGKKMKVENFSLEDAKVKKGTTGELKRIFAGAMKNRLTSRVVLNKFIQEVA
tara:strand:- start:274 stop:972 length:699 start_codon:yes stop_codon:yes gene_type:complete